MVTSYAIKFNMMACKHDFTHLCKLDKAAVMFERFVTSAITSNIFMAPMICINNSPQTLSFLFTVCGITHPLHAECSHN